MINVENFRIVFSHEPELSGEVASKLKDMQGINTTPKGFTTCSISKDEELYSHSIAVCSEQDNFSREKGRQVSLAKAIQDLPSSEKKLLFDAYNKRKPDLSNKVLIKGEWYDEDFVYDLIAMHTPKS